MALCKLRNSTNETAFVTEINNRVLRVEFQRHEYKCEQTEGKL
jgi:hypothetical protein